MENVRNVLGNKDEMKDLIQVPGKNGEIKKLMQVTENADEIRQQNKAQAFFSKGKNIQALAENDEVLAGTMKSLLELFLLTMRSMVNVKKNDKEFKENYNAFKCEMLKLAEDVNETTEMELKFKRAYERMEKKSREDIWWKVWGVLVTVIAIVGLVV